MSDRLKEGAKFDGGKLRFDLVPVIPFMLIVKVFTFGAVKYEDRNWEKGIKYSRIFGGIMRHLWAWWGGEAKDPESGISHLAHAGCGILFLLEYERTKVEYDDREEQNYPLEGGQFEYYSSLENTHAKEDALQTIQTT